MVPEHCGFGVWRETPSVFFISASGQNQHMGATSIYCLSSGFSRDDGGAVSTYFSHRLALTSVGAHIGWHAHRLARTSVGTHIGWRSHRSALTSVGAHIGRRSHRSACECEFQGGVFHGIYPPHVCLLPACVCCQCVFDTETRCVSAGDFGLVAPEHCNFDVWREAPPRFFLFSVLGQNQHMGATSI